MKINPKHTFIVGSIFGIVMAGLALPGRCEEKPAGATLSLSLKGAIETAFQKNKELQIQGKEVDAARAVVLGQKSAFLPQVSAGSGYTRNGNILKIGSSSGAKKDSQIFTGYVNDNRSNVAVNQTIYNGGADIAAYKQAKVSLDIEAQTLRATKQYLAFEVKRLYNGLLLAEETARIAQDLVDLAQSHYEDTKKKFAAGVVSRFDVLQSKVQVSKSTPELIRAKNAVELIAAELKKIMGLKMSDTVQLTEKLAFIPVVYDEQKFLNLALLNNPEMAAATLGVDVGKLGIDLARAAGNPQVDANAGYTWRSNDMGDMFNSRHDNWSAGISVTMPIFDGFSSRAKVEEARARYSQTLISKENFADELAVDVKRGGLDLKKAEALINSQKDYIEQAKEALRISKVRYDNGEGTNLDVLYAQVSVSQVEKTYSDGIFDYLMAAAYLDRVVGVGMDLPEGETKTLAAGVP